MRREGEYAEAMVGYHVSARLFGWQLEPDDMSEASVLTVERADVNAFWQGVDPDAIRLRVGDRWWTYRQITVLSDTLYSVSGTPEVTA